MGRWLFVKPERDPKSIISKFWGKDALDSFLRSEETLFAAPLQRRIFISYRRMDSIETSNSIQRELSAIFGEENVFTDFQRIPAGSDYYQEIEREIGKCDTVLVLIGPNWLNAREKDRRRRLESKDDMVRMEILAAINRQVAIVPVLIDGTPIPLESELPDELRPLCKRQAVNFRHTDFRHSIESIVRLVRRPRVPSLQSHSSAPPS
jgi:hypothetical protein